MRTIQVKAPAKINIGLNIVRKRDDGFHDLETFFYPIHDLFDTLTFSKAEAFSFNCDDSTLQRSNLVIKAKELLENETGKIINVNVNLAKMIPSGAGLGGGSSDAAITLSTLNKIFNLKMSDKRLAELALTLGSDVPFFLKLKPAIGKSRGEKLILTDFTIPYYILIINPRIHISTKEAFANITPSHSNIDYDKVFVNFDSFRENRNHLSNDFEKYVFQKHPAIKSIKETIIKNGAVFSLMSGSGSTVYGFFEKKSDAEYVIDKLPADYFSFISLPKK